ncbi:MAG: 5-(carboxyamino)imidazole ribonucleotide mutase [Christensenellales bacterium]
MASVAIVMGSDSDFPVLKEACKTLQKFSISFSVNVISAHRTPERAAAFAQSARQSGIKVIIAAAGKAAHLAGVLAAHTTLPVIGIPVKSTALDGMDALLSTVQMPPGVPVATVGIDGAQNAALLAVQIMSLQDENLAEALSEYKKSMAEGVAQKDEALQKALKELL